MELMLKLLDLKYLYPELVHEMLVSKSEMHVFHLPHLIATLFQRLYLCFQGPTIQYNHIGVAVELTLLSDLQAEDLRISGVKAAIFVFNFRFNHALTPTFFVGL